MIVSSEIIENTLQRDGARHITEAHTDHLGGVLTHFYRCYDASQIRNNLNNRVARMNEIRKEQEINRVLKIIDSGGSPNLRRLEFATTQEIRTAYTERISKITDEVTDLEARKTRMESEVTR